MAVKLIVKPPGADKGEFPYSFDQDKIVIGRGPGADVRLPSAAVSEVHCVVRLEAQDYVLFDPGSTNGTKHNGQVLSGGRRRLLRSGDRIEVAGFEIVFRGGLPMEGVHTAERTAALARRMVREALQAFGPSGEPPRLTFLNGNRAGERCSIPEKPDGISIGRDLCCEVRIDDSDSSRRHAAIRRSWEGTFVADLGSKNGTIVNDEPVRGERKLRDRDELLIGATRVVFEDPAEAFLRELELVEVDAVAPAGLAQAPSAGVGEAGNEAAVEPAAPDQPVAQHLAAAEQPDAVSSSTDRRRQTDTERIAKPRPISRAGDVVVVLLGVAIVIGAIAALIIVLR